MAEAKVIISADASKHVSEMGKAAKSVDKYGESWKNIKDIAVGNILAGLAGKATGALIDLEKSAYQTANAIKDLSDNTRLSTDQIQALQLTAEDNAASAEEMQAVIYKLSNAWMDLKSNVPDAVAKVVDALQQLGMTSEEIDSITTRGDLIEKLTKKMAESQGQAEKLSGAFKLIGDKLGGRLVAALTAYGEGGGFAGAFAKYQKSIMTEEEIMGAEAIETRLKKAESLAKSGAATAFRLEPGAKTSADEARKARKEDWEKQKENQKHLKSTAELEKDKRDAEEKDRIEKETKKRQEKIAEINATALEEKKALKEGGAVSAGGSIADNFMRIGGALGGQAGFNARVADRQLAVTQEMKKIDEKMLKALEKLVEDPPGGLE